jgi:hypothetical protein
MIIITTRFCKKLKNPHLFFKFFMLGEGTPFQLFLGFWAQPQAMASAGPPNPGRAPKEVFTFKVENSLNFIFVLECSTSGRTSRFKI